MESVRQFLAIAFVLALLGAARWALRNGALRRRAGPREALKIAALRGGLQKEKTFAVLERIALTPQHTLHVIRAGAEEWIVATHPRGCTVVHKSRSGGAAT